jgi:hypothetical protein
MGRYPAVPLGLSAVHRVRAVRRREETPDARPLDMLGTTDASIPVTAADVCAVPPAGRVGVS